METSEKHLENIKQFLNTPRVGLFQPSGESLRLFELAFTHRSLYGETTSYERLEFLGDRVLNLIVANYLFENHKNYSVGEMSKKIEFVKNENLANTIQKINLFPENLINLGKGTRLTPNICADVFEAFIGAVYRNYDYTKANEIVLNLFSDEIENFQSNN